MNVVTKILNQKLKKNKSNAGKNNVVKSNTCTKRNPSPPCANGFMIKENKKGDECCYKDTKPKTKKNKSNAGKNNVVKSNTCTKRNPSPPCANGFMIKENKKGDECCYKGTSKKTKKVKKKYKSLSEPNKKELLKLFDIFWTDNEFSYVSLLDDLPSDALLNVSDVKSVIDDGQIIDVLEPQGYEVVSVLDLDHDMFVELDKNNEQYQLGYFMDENLDEEDGPVTSGSGSDLWLKANDTLFNFLKKYKPSKIKQEDNKPKTKKKKTKSKEVKENNVKKNKKTKKKKEDINEKFWEETGMLGVCHLEFKEGKSNKFWQYKIKDNKALVNFGKIGSDGQEKQFTYKDIKEAIIEMDKLKKSKIKKGYKIVTDTIQQWVPGIMAGNDKPKTKREIFPSLQDINHYQLLKKMKYLNYLINIWMKTIILLNIYQKIQF